MPLVIHLRKNQKAILNGAVIENVSGRTISIAVRNEAKVLRSDDMIDPEDAVTPATRVYLALQYAYLVPELTAQHLAACHELLDGCLAVLPEAGKIAADIVSAIDGGNLYAALRYAHALVHHEAAILLQGNPRSAVGQPHSSLPRAPAACEGRVPDRGGARRDAAEALASPSPSHGRLDGTQVGTVVTERRNQRGLLPDASFWRWALVSARAGPRSGRSLQTVRGRLPALPHRLHPGTSSTR